ncbi:hypothetical protein SAMN05216456_1239 [Devosia crocina]|uniref:Uncharacterized protein n=2 Tax=Devosia crocina TaxID=429728 RepID=A0A1I7N8V0_9HYPH|nr:hypothetical protein SAMN05216456_1239 [Devosia crocina]
MRFALCSLLALTSPVLAQEDLRIDQTKIHVSNAEACGLIEEKGIDAFMDLDFLVLDFTKGIESMEFHCNFFDVKSREGSAHLFIDAICEIPGEIYPDILAVTPYSETEVQVASSADIAWATRLELEDAEMVDTMVPTGTTIYTRCDNLSEITVD